MIEVSIVLTVTAVLLRLTPDIALSRWIRTHLVERAATRLMRLERKDVIFVFVLAGLLLFAGELVVTLGSADLLLGYAADLTIYGEAVIAVSTLAVVSRMKTAVRVISARLPRKIATTRRRARRQIRPPRATASNDDNLGELGLLAG